MNLQVFKNGYALVSKTYNLPPSQEGGKATFSLGEPPKHACHGTVWLTASNETTVLGMRAESSTTTEAVLCTSVPSLLRANKGSMVSVKLQGGWVDGKVIDVSGGLEELGLGLLSLACMEDGTSSGKVMAIPLQDIMRVNGTDGQFKLSTDEKKVQKAVIVDYKGAGGAASLVHLRGGFCWAPSYHWQLHDTDKATLSGNATIMNESEEGGVFDKLQCVVGAPNMKFGRVGDPFLVSGSIEQFLHELSIEGSGQGYQPNFVLPIVLPIVLLSLLPPLLPILLPILQPIAVHIVLPSVLPILLHILLPLLLPVVLHILLRIRDAMCGPDRPSAMRCPVLAPPFLVAMRCPVLT
eukprot:CAMPEP_0177695564 /NCGR_PEP_ID=MMETSP0484_2-20121128/3523_1 /TAXON_ID=354590 /ORGANISM="Rhodomonas lens, Strain RHODO" /LENGTH=351 /DNA_ID=CAMNT_0019206495 /DNA_START=112 /DNA_END=1167 /DNA_ORIENTATION=-